MSTNTILAGDALEMLRTLPDQCVQTCITSPPYYALRDYGTTTWDSGESTCDHEKAIQEYLYRMCARSAGLRIGIETQMQAGRAHPQACPSCGATRIDRQIGLEETPVAYIAKLVEVFREVHRVLRNDGTCWINIGDTYARGRIGRDDSGDNGKFAGPRIDTHERTTRGLSDKNLLGIPWMLAFALRDDGWILRSEVIWHKPNAMPESVTDRPSKAHETIFLLAKRERYFYDADAIREPLKPKTLTTYGLRKSVGKGNDELGEVKADNWNRSTPEKKPRLTDTGEIAGANKRSVWTVFSQPYPEAHFACFPPKLIEPCILAGSAARACEHCGAPWARIKSHATGGSIGKAWNDHQDDWQCGNRANKLAKGGDGYTPGQTIGWKPTCTCSQEGTGASVVLDPFMGAGTTALVALQHHRRYIGIELNPAYVALAEKRIREVQPVLWTEGVAG